MAAEEKLVNLAWEIGEASQHRAAMLGLRRNNPSAATKEWLAEARANMRKLQARWRLLQDKRYSEWNRAA